MSTIITTKFRIYNAESFKEGFNESLPTNIYTAIGKVTPWNSEDIYLGASQSSSDNIVPNPIDHVQSDFEVWRNIISLKKVEPSDVSHVIPNVEWEKDQTYTMYKDDIATLYMNATSSPFYVMTDEHHVYKCIYNNNGGPSTEKPNQTLTNSTFTLTDGYVWKYMYTVSAADAFKFMTTSYIPVKMVLENPGSGCNSQTNQWDVQQAAVDGKIEYIYRHYLQTDIDDDGLEITPAGLGDGYTSATGNLQTITNDDKFQLTEGDAPDELNFYKGATIYFPNEGTDLPEVSFVITEYDQTNRTISVVGLRDDLGNRKVTNPNASYKILPTVVVEGDGTGLEAIAVMHETNPAQIDKIRIINGGTGYTKATVTFENAQGKTPEREAKFSVAISPRGGHGSNPVRELGGFFIMLNTKFEYNEGGVPTQNDFRQISLIKDPIMYEQQNGAYVKATDTILNQTKTLYVRLQNSSAPFSVDDTIIQDLGGSDGEIARAVVVDAKFSDDSGDIQILRVNNINGTFSVVSSEIKKLLSDGNLSQLGTEITSIANEDLKPYSGEVLFVEQRTNIQRDNSQIEDIKMILEF